jgi:hypothetical protein
VLGHLSTIYYLLPIPPKEIQKMRRNVLNFLICLHKKGDWIRTSNLCFIRRDSSQLNYLFGTKKCSKLKHTHVERGGRERERERERDVPDEDFYQLLIAP